MDVSAEKPAWAEHLADALEEIAVWTLSAPTGPCAADIPGTAIADALRLIPAYETFACAHLLAAISLAKLAAATTSDMTALALSRSAADSLETLIVWCNSSLSLADQRPTSLLLNPGPPRRGCAAPDSEIPATDSR
jgi:hypothetical protein